MDDEIRARLPVALHAAQIDQAAGAGADAVGPHRRHVFLGANRSADRDRIVHRAARHSADDDHARAAAVHCRNQTRDEAVGLVAGDVTIEDDGLAQSLCLQG